ncbi:condensation domain-containing protein [Nocardia salmonicida]|jgi:hypothetical protein|uniref:condensation domain-containing protein n=1 Tax=Nocardia salmonicida TaxID=53431 RepID=UPI0007A43ABB|nr:condensation domain-containing protein [Nocardia salmonicida]
MSVLQTDLSIEDWSPEAGELLEFRPDAHAIAAAAAAPASDVPPSVLTRAHITRCIELRRAGRRPSPGLVLTFRLPGRLDRTALREAFRAFILRHETFRSWFAPAADNELIRHEYRSEDVAFTTVERGTFDCGDAIRAELLPDFIERSDALAWPGFVCATIDHGDRGFTVIFSVDHAHSDALSMGPAFLELRTLYTAYQQGNEPPSLTDVGSFVEFARTEHEYTGNVGPQAERVCEFVSALRSAAAEFRPVPVDLGLEHGQTAPSGQVQLALFDDTESDLFSERCAAHGGNFSSGLYAALALTELELAGYHHFTALSVYGLRNEPQYLMAQGWFVNLLPVSFEVGHKAQFSELVGTARAACDSIKPLARVPLHGVLEHARVSGPVPTPSEWRQISYADTRQILRALRLENEVSVSIMGSRNQLSGLTPFWFTRDLDHTFVAVRFPDTSAARESVTELLTHLRTVLRTIVDTGDYTATNTDDASAVADEEPNA